MDNDILFIIILIIVFITRIILEILYRKGALIKLVMTGKHTNSNKVSSDI